MLVINIRGYSQIVTQDSIAQLTFSHILISYFKASEEPRDKKKAFYYASLYLARAKVYKKNKIHHAAGHYLMALEGKKSEVLMHLDSVIFISKYLEDKSEYPCTAYLLKANLFYSNKDFDNALANYLLALKSSKLVKNRPIEVEAKTYIGIIKLERTGSEQEAIEIFRQCMSFYKEGNNKKEYFNDYLFLLHDFSEGFRRIYELDSSRYYNLIGIKESQKFNAEFLRNYFTFSEGINQVLLKNYVAARDSLKNSYSLIDKSNDHANKIISNYYLAESYQGLKQTDTAIFYFAKTDSIYQKHKVYSNEVKKMYQNKMEIAKKNGNLKKELFYVTRMLELDSLKHQNFTSLSKTLKEKYDNQSLLEQQSKLEKQLIKTSTNAKVKTYLLYTSLLLFLITYGFFYRKKQKFKALFKKVMEMEQEAILPLSTPKKAIEKINIPEEAISKILEGLSIFEQNGSFLKPQLTISEVAKFIETNSKYLTNVLKTYKDKTLPNYINDLRIAHIINRLKNEAEFKTFTMNYISEEAGFTNMVSFRKAFYRYTKLQPSQFVRELKKSKDS